MVKKFLKGEAAVSRKWEKGRAKDGWTNWNTKHCEISERPLQTELYKSLNRSTHITKTCLSPFSLQFLIPVFCSLSNEFSCRQLDFFFELEDFALAPKGFISSNLMWESGSIPTALALALALLAKAPHCYTRYLGLIPAWGHFPILPSGMSSWKISVWKMVFFTGLLSYSQS